MLIKNKKILFNILFVLVFFFSTNIKSEEFDISAKEIIIDKEKETIIGKESVKAIDSSGQIITADKIVYNKLKEFLIAEGNVEILDTEGNILKSNKATYDKLKEIIITYDSTELSLSDGYNLKSKDILYNVKNKILSSKNNSIFKDAENNLIETSMFQYNIKDNLFTSIGKIKVVDVKKNKYFFKEIYIDTNKKEMIGSDVSVVLDQSGFGTSEKTDPRLVSNSIFVSKNKSELSKGVFTVCQKKEDEKCPPWSLKANKIIHDREKKNIYYEKAMLKVYNVPIFYFPRFFHPDPTVKRQSGFLAPYFTNSGKLGTGVAVPYYWAINNDKDMTFTTKPYSKEGMLFLNEYRQAFSKGFFTLDSSYTTGYKNNSKTKTKGSRNHIFSKLDLNLSEEDSYKSSLSIKTQKTSNDTYFKVHDINTSLVNADDTVLNNEIKYSYAKNNTYFNITSNAYEDLNLKKKSDKYEYILPNIVFGKTFFSEQYGNFDFKSTTLNSQYATNKSKTFVTNDLLWNPPNVINKLGFLNTFEAMLRNINYDTKKTEEYKNDKTVNELHGVMSYKSSLPLKKNGINYANFFSPNMMLRYAPGHMRNLRSNDETFNHTNLYALNRTSEIESGLSAVLGFDFKINKKLPNNNETEKLSISMGQVFNYEKNKDIPSKTSLDQKMSDVVGTIDYNFSEIGKIGYKFSVDHNMQDLNYNEVSTELNFGKVQFNLDYLEQQNHVGNEHYVSSGLSLNLTENNKLGFSTKKNFKTDSTELYNISYQYEIDCLSAGLVYRREFYHDSDLDKQNTLMFTISFVPFGKINTPSLNQ